MKKVISDTVGMLFIKRKKKIGKKNPIAVLSEQAIYFYNQYYRFFTDVFGTHCVFEINRSFSGLRHILIC